MEVPNNDGIIEKLTNSYCVFYYDTVDFVSFHYGHDLSTEKDNNVIEKEAYLFYKDSQTICQLDTLGEGFTVSVMPYSTPVKVVKAKLEPARYINPEPDSTVYDRSTGDTVEYYYMHPKTPGNRGRTVKLYYSDKFKKYKESFDSTFDRLKGKKLYRYEQINDAYYSKEYKMHTPELKTIYEMRDLSPGDIEKAKRALDYYLKMPKREQ